MKIQTTGKAVPSKTVEPKILSKCCSAPVKVDHGCDSDVGHTTECKCWYGVTMYYVCKKCGKACDAVPAKK